MNLILCSKAINFITTLENKYQIYRQISFSYQLLYREPLCNPWCCFWTQLTPLVFVWYIAKRFEQLHFWIFVFESRSPESSAETWFCSLFVVKTDFHLISEDVVQYSKSFVVGNAYCLESYFKVESKTLLQFSNKHTTISTAGQKVKNCTEFALQFYGEALSFLLDFNKINWMLPMQQVVHKTTKFIHFHFCTGEQPYSCLWYR